MCLISTSLYNVNTLAILSYKKSYLQRNERFDQDHITHKNQSLNVNLELFPQNLMLFLKNLLGNKRKKEKEMSFQHDTNFVMNTYPMNV